MTPIQASKKENEDRFYFNLYEDIKHINKKAKLKIGDNVRIPKYERKILTGVIPQIGQKKFLLLPVC